MKFVFALLVLTLAMTAACDTPQSRSSLEAERQAQSRRSHVAKNEVEFNNYNRRQQLSDDPTVILWCTFSFDNPSSPFITMPIVGKLTSGNKRPYVTADGIHERPGPDGMYGSSGEYRYGFTPAGVYADFYNVGTFCTTEPTVWQREKTEIVMRLDPQLLDAHTRAREALKQGRPEEATRILEEVIKNTGGR